MFPVVNIGPLAVQTPGLFILAGIWIGMILAERKAHRQRIDPNLVDNLILFSLVGGILGARLIFIAQYPAPFLDNPLSILSVNPLMLDVAGGMAVGFIIALVYGQRKKLPFWETLDILTPGMAVMLIAVGFAHLASGSAYGTSSSLPWAINLWGTQRHPTQVYEILVSSIALGLVLVTIKQEARLFAVKGSLFWGVIALSALNRLFLEHFRADSPLIFTHYRLPQVIAWGILAVSLLWIGIQMRQKSTPIVKLTGDHG